MEAVLDKCQEVMDPELYPYENSIYGWSSNALFPIEMIKDYYAIDRKEKAHHLAEVLYGQIEQVVLFYLDFYPTMKDEFEYACNLVYFMTNEISKAGDESFAVELSKKFSSFLNDNTSIAAQ